MKQREPVRAGGSRTSACVGRGREVIGFTAPGGFANGFLGEPRLPEAVLEAWRGR